MSHSQSQLEIFKTEWNTCRTYDDQKLTLITSVLAYAEDLSKKLSEAEYELRDKKDVIKLMRDRFSEAEKQMQTLQLEKARHVFASVLIDGDCMPFKDELIKEGLVGGKKTASLLKQAIEEELQSSIPSAHHVTVIVRVYANMKGLAKTYKDLTILPPSTSFDDFVRGFNMSDAMYDFVDAGNGKECSDEKIKANFRRDLADMHCQKLLFGGTADNGYARLLGPLTENETVRERITLLEGPPFASELAHVKAKFRTVLFENVFRNQKLPNIKRKVSSHFAPPHTPSTNYATAAAKASSTPISVLATQPSSAVNRRRTGATVLQNQLGQRVDPPLSYDHHDFLSMKSLKLCNTFHLLGKCSYLEEYGNCQHDHVAILNDKQMVALRAVARQSPCPRGLFCSDPECLSGHRCTRDNCSRSTCWFSLEMHNVETVIVN